MLFRVLGTLEAEHGGRLLDLGRPKQRALLASLLLSANRVVSADRLIDELWGDGSPANAGAALQVQVSRLRRALSPVEPPRLESRPPGYVLHVADDEVDSLHFERLLAEARRAAATNRPGAAAERLRAALALWRGSALAEFVFAEFAQPHIARLEELRLVAYEEQAAAELALGHHAQVATRLRTLVEEHPLREGLWRHLVVALYRCGRQADALRGLAELRERLIEELGIELSPALAELESDVLLQSASLAWRPPAEALPGEAVPHNLPAARSSLIGRHEELAELDKLLDDTRMLTVVGPGGVGKTRLAVELARHRRPAHADGVWLVELAPLADGALVAQAVASAVGVHEEPARAIAETLVDALGDRDVLIVLDNCEHLVGPVAALADRLLASCSQLTLVATSREPLRIEGETLWAARALDIPPADALGPEALGQYAAVRLFVERATAQGPFALTQGNAPGVGELCRRLDGVPLAIELAAGRVRTLSPSEMVRRLDDRFELLESGLRTAVPRHRTLRAAVEWSYELLEEQERVLFDRLSVFSGGFSMEAAEAVGADQRIPRSVVVGLLSRLVDQSLVQIEENNGGVRFRLLETLRQYGTARLNDGADREEVRIRHLAWCLTFAEAAGPEPLRLDAEQDNFRQALRWALQEKRVEAAMRLALALAPFWFRMGHTIEGGAWLHEILDRDDSAPGALRARALVAAAVMANTQSDFKASGALAHEAIALAAEGADPAVEAEASFLLGNIALRRADSGDTREWYERSLDAWAASGVAQGLIYSRTWVEMNLGVNAQQSGDNPGARRHFERALEDRNGLDDCLESILLGRLAVVAEAEGNRDRARRLLDRARRVAAGRGEMTIADFIDQYVQLELLWGNTEHASVLAKEALQRAHRGRQQGRVARLLFRLAQIATVDGDFQKAACLFGVAARIRREIGYVFTVPEQIQQQQSMDRIRAQLGDTANEAWDEAELLSLDEAVTSALGAFAGPAGSPPQATKPLG